MEEKKAHKRLNYFTGQLLNEDDFTNEQQYHVDALRSHNTNLHTWGIAKGLNVEKTGTKNVTVSMGMAIDGMGRQIVLDELKEVDLSTSTDQSLYLFISYEEKKTDLKEGEGEKGYTRIAEEAVIEYSPDKPSEPSRKMVLAKLIFDREKDALKTIDLEERRNVKNIGGDIDAKSITFSNSSEADPEKFAKIKGMDAGLEIISRNTKLKGNLDVSGILTGTIGKNLVGMDQIITGSVPISRMNTIMSSGTAEIGPGSEAKVDITEPDTKHRFFITSVIPITPNSAIEWKWQVEKGKINSISFDKSIKFLKQKMPEKLLKKDKDQKIIKLPEYEKNKFSYVLVVKNLSNQKIEVEFKYYEILE